MATPTSLRLPPALDQLVRERARLERRSLSNVLRCLIERGLAPSAVESVLLDEDEDEVERLAAVGRETLGEEF